jgi:hypothetical protein
MKLSLLLSFILSLSLFPSDSQRTIKLSELQMNQRVILDWTFQGCFNVEHYKLTFVSVPKPQVKIERVEPMACFHSIYSISSSNASEMRSLTRPITLEQMSELDEALALYQSEGSSDFQPCVESESATLWLYTDKTLLATETIKSCAPTKIGSLIDSLKGSQFQPKPRRAAIN